MDFIGQLWIPILAASAFCFIASAVLWMMGPHHKGDWKGAPDQEGVMKVLRDAGATEGAYMFPYADRSNKTAFEEKMKEWAVGPSGIMYIYPRGAMGMGKMMAQQLVFFVIANFFLAYVGHHAGLDGAPYLRVFQVIGCTGFMMYALGTVPESIWFGRPWRHWVTGAFDGLVYALLAAGTFGWLWPR